MGDSLAVAAGAGLEKVWIEVLLAMLPRSAGSGRGGRSGSYRATT